MKKFERWAAAGFTADLLPIIPPKATMSPRSTVPLENRGKTPGRVYAGGWGGFPGWQANIATAAQISTWDATEALNGAGVGLAARRCPGVDIDVYNPQVAAMLADMAEFILGPAPRRTGQPPKCLLAYRLGPDHPPVTKRRLEFTLAGDETAHAVEILGDGQQYLVEGIHAKTNQPYTWTQDPASIGAGNLTPITADKITEYLDAVSAQIQQMGGAIKARAEYAGGDSTGDRAFDGVNPDTVRDALLAMGNDLPYDQWITMVAACKATLGEPGYGIYEEWCLLYQGNTAEIAREKWDSVRPPFRVGAEYILEQAALRGWGGYGFALGFEPVEIDEPMPGEGPDDETERPEWMQGWVYALDQERFIRLEDRYALTERQFTRLLAGPNFELEGKKTAARRYLENPLRWLVNAMTYLPGGPDFVRDSASVKVNMWCASAMEKQGEARAKTVQDADVRLWLDHVAFILPDPIARKVVLDWLAHILQHPADKPNWSIFLGGEQGIGKDMLFTPVIEGVGELNSRIVQPDELTSEYTDWIANKRLIVVEEMRSFEKKAVMNKLKLYITKPPNYVPVHQKYLPVYQIPNVAAFIFMSNFKDALALEQGDRRYFVYWSPAMPQSESYYSVLGDWLENRGGMAEVVAWLMARQITGFNAAGRAPDTPDKQAMALAGMTDFEQAVIEGIESRSLPFDVELCTLQGLYEALPNDMKRLPGAGPKKLAGALQAAGGGLVKDQNGKERRINLDAGDAARARFGYAHVWALRDPEMWCCVDTAVIRDQFRRAWVPGEETAPGAAPFENTP